MKYLSSRFEEYISEKEKKNLHPELEIVYDKIKKNPNKENIIFYGPSGVGKYTQALSYIQNFSPSKLKYERKILIQTIGKKEYKFKLSDIHFEINMGLLGCNAKVLFNDIYNNIIDIVSTKQNNKTFFVLCNNFHLIHSELLDIFSSYMQSLTHKNIKLVYILISENISFIDNNILDRCQLIPVKRPTKNMYKKCLGKKIDCSLNTITNIKNIISEIKGLDQLDKKIVDEIIHNIENYNSINFLNFRDLIYNLFIYNLNIESSIYKILYYFIENKRLNDDNMRNVILKLGIFFKLYNNNYRPIYHLESFLYYLCKVVNGL